MKKGLSGLLAAGIAGSALTAFPAQAAGSLLQTDFESGLDGWTARGNAQVAVSTATASSGAQSAAVTNRTDAWNGIAHDLDASIWVPGQTYSFSAKMIQSATVMPVHFKLSLQYSTGGGGNATYVSIAEGDAASGMWLTLSNDSYMIPEGATNMVLYIETEDSTVDFNVDDIYSGAPGKTPAPADSGKPDLTGDGNVDRADAEALRDFLLTKSTPDLLSDGDLDSNGVIDSRDLTLLKRYIADPPAETTAPPVSTTTPPVETDPPTAGTTEPSASGNYASPKEIMAAVRSSLVTYQNDVPGNVKTGDQGTTTHFTYMSEKAGHEKGANVWLPPGYSADKKYNVIYMNHGIFGDESGMLNGFSIREMASNLITSGKAEPFIIVFPQMYTDPGSAQPNMMTGMNMDTMDHYDDFVFDLRDSLMPYVESHWSVMTGREHTAIAGFSMGGRESLYIGMMLPDKIGYVCASSPAPGIVPASDNFIANHLGSYNLARTARLTEPDFKYSDSDLPYIVMIGGGTNDNVVGTFPKQYHELYEKNGTEHVWLEVPGGGHDGSVGTQLFYVFFQYVFKA